MCYTLNFGCKVTYFTLVNDFKKLHANGIFRNYCAEKLHKMQIFAVKKRISKGTQCVPYSGIWH